MESLEASESASVHRDKYLNNRYSLEDFANPLLRGKYKSPHLNAFFSANDFSEKACLELVHALTTRRDGFCTYKLGTDASIHGSVLFADARGVNYNSHAETLTFLWILKKCGKLDAVFAALPDLPEDFPLLLMCFDDSAIRQRVETYMGLPGLKDMYDTALNPRKIGLKDQLKLVRFGEKNPHFQDLLAASLYRYGYHLYNQYVVGVDWFTQDFAHFSRASGGDLLCFLTNRADILPQIAQILEFGPGTRFAHESVVSQGFRSSWVFFLRALLGFLAMRKDPALDTWIEAYPENSWNAGTYKMTKLYDLVKALRK